MAIIMKWREKMWNFSYNFLNHWCTKLKRLKTNSLVDFIRSNFWKKRLDSKRFYLIFKTLSKSWKEFIPKVKNMTTYFAQKYLNLYLKSIINIDKLSPSIYLSLSTELFTFSNNFFNNKNDELNQFFSFLYKIDS